MVRRIWRKSVNHGCSSKLPPGPRKLPLIGNLHNFVGILPHHCLRNLAKKYGPIMHLQLGEVSTFVISSIETAKDVMKTHDLIFASRPSFPSLKLLTHNFTNIALAPYGDYWRQVRKICTTELLNPMRMRSFKTIREEEVLNLIRDISTKAGSVINLREMMYSTTLSITSRAAFGEKSKHQEEFKQLASDYLASFGGLKLVDLFPSVKLLHLIHAMRPKSRRLHHKVDEILENIIMEHRAKRATGWTEADDLVYTLLDLQDHGELEIPLTTDNIKAVIMDVFSGGGDTSNTVLEWAMAEMLKNPIVMEKAQAEVRHVFAGKKCVDEAGLHELKYLNLVIKETLRLHPAAPLLAPRESRERCEIDGYEIPEKSRVVINAWAIGRDPKYWTQADKFLPNRFLDSTADYKGSNYEFIPFGAGRRMCPGISFATATIELALANLLHHFDWKLPDGKTSEDLDMTEVFSTVGRKKIDLCVIPIPYHPAN
ncbi:hypothetical protein SLEP1_g38320 [Rubroshorea leprosula]|nr:hypothetical protein SLEP1_g38320 [Rubroshorea leprosula]